MPYVSTAERIGIKKGIEESMSTIRQALTLVIQLKFGESGKHLLERVSRMRDLAGLQKLTEHLTHAQNLPELEKLLDEKEVISH